MDSNSINIRLTTDKNYNIGTLSPAVACHRLASPAAAAAHKMCK